MIKIKLELQKLTDLEIVSTTKTIATKLTNNMNFTSPPVIGTTLTADANSLDTLLQQRAGLELQLQQLTLATRTAREKCESELNLDATYVEQVINTILSPATAVDPVVAAAKALTAGMEVASARAPVGPMPKVEGLKATQGDADGWVDLHWGPVKRGLSNYILERTEDPLGQTGWQVVDSPTKSSTTQKGLTSGKRYWFRVSANGSAGPGPASDPTTKVAP